MVVDKLTRYDILLIKGGSIMPKITLDLETLKKEKMEHEEAIRRIDCILNYYFANSKTEDSVCETRKNNAPEQTRMQRALEICTNYLKEGNTVNTTNEFLKIIEQHGVKLSRAGLGLAFKKFDSSIYFDAENRTWKLKNT